MIDPEETKRKKAMSLRYRKAMVKDLNMDSITESLWEIRDACQEVHWYCDTDDGSDTLINALDGDEDQAYEFKMMFSDLEAECEQMMNDLDDWQNETFKEYFNDLFVAADADEYGGGLLGYDAYEGDYFGLTYGDNAKKCSKSRLKRLTKDELIEHVQFSIRILCNYLALRSRYDNLKAAMDILRDQNTGYLQMITQIAELYDKAEKESYGFKYKFCKEVKELDQFLENLPQEAWIQ